MTTVPVRSETVELPARTIISNSKNAKRRTFIARAEGMSTFIKETAVKATYIGIVVYFNELETPDLPELITQSVRERIPITIFERLEEYPRKDQIISSYKQVRDPEQLYIRVSSGTLKVLGAEFKVYLQPHLGDYALGMTKRGHSEDSITQQVYLHYKVSEISTERARVRIAQSVSQPNLF